MRSIASHLEKAERAYDQIDPSSLLDESLVEVFIEKKRQLDQASHIINHVATNYDDFLILLGSEEPQNILVLNQNQDELRAGG